MMIVLHLVIVPGGLAQGVSNLVLGLVVSNVGPSSSLWILSNESDSGGRFSFDGFEYFHNDGPLVVFGAGGHVSGDIFSHQVAQHFVALCNIE